MIFCDDDQKNILSVKRNCNFTKMQLMHVDPQTAMTEHNFKRIMNMFLSGFTEQ